IAKIRYRKHRGKNRLESVVLALRGQLVHLKKSLVRAALHFYQVRNLDGGRNLGKIETATNGAILVGHALLLIDSSIRGEAIARVPRCPLPCNFLTMRPLRPARNQRRVSARRKSRRFFLLRGRRRRA